MRAIGKKKSIDPNNRKVSTLRNWDTMSTGLFKMK
jgi:hypothetical protein